MIKPGHCFPPAACRWRGVVCAALFALVLCAGNRPAVHAAAPGGTMMPAAGPFVVGLQQPSTPAATEQYVPIGELPPEEQLPAPRLLIAAYVFVWLALLVYVFSLWRRLGKVERDLTSVARQLPQQRRE